MSARPIFLSAPMVRAILEGRKTVVFVVTDLKTGRPTFSRLLKLLEERKRTALSQNSTYRKMAAATFRRPVKGERRRLE